MVERLRELAAKSPDAVLTVYLFGSLARGEAGPASDIDLAVLLKEPYPHALANPADDLAATVEADIGRTVDAVILNTAPPDLVHRVLRDGILLLDRDPGTRIRFEVRLRNEYFDLKPYLDEYRRAGAHRP